MTPDLDPAADSVAELVQRVLKAVSRGKHARIEADQALALMAHPAWSTLSATKDEVLRRRCPVNKPRAAPLPDQGPELPLGLPPPAESSSGNSGCGIAPTAMTGRYAGMTPETTPELLAAVERAASARALAAVAQISRRQMH